MVRFSVRLRDNIYAEWRNDYLDYKLLKLALKQKRDAATPQPPPAIPVIPGATHAMDSVLFQSSELWAGRSYIPTLPCTSSAASVNRSRLEGSTTLRPRKRHANVAASDEERQRLVRARATTTSTASLETLLDQQYRKVERAYRKHLTYLSGQFDLLREQYRPQASRATQESVKNTLVELYRLLNHLLNFALLNYTGFVQIFKKHDAMFPTQQLTFSDRHRTKLTTTCSFPDPVECRALLSKVALMFSDLFCEGNSSVAVAVLMTRREDAVVDWAVVYMGIKIGACLVLLVWAAWDSLVVSSLKSDHHRSNSFAIIDLARTRAFPLYRGIGCVLLLHWLLGVSIYVWRSARINYRYMFEVNPRHAPHYTAIFSDATNMTMVYLVNVLLYYKVVNGYFPEQLLMRGYYPLFLFVYAVYFYVVRPWRRQVGVMQTILEIAGAPFFPVTFFHVFVANYITSMVKVFQDLAWSVCFLASREFLDKDLERDGSIRETSAPLLLSTTASQSACASSTTYVNIVVPLICALPLWWRFLQNLRRVYDTRSWWPHLPCAFMYALAQVVALFGLFHPFYNSRFSDSDDQEQDEVVFHLVWLALFTISALYTWVWDVWMDWGLGRPQYQFLSDRHMFARTWVYYAAIALDLFLRFAWTLTLIPPQPNSTLPFYLQPCMMVLELFRRTVWGFFRLENEHLRNTQGFRRVDFIPLHYDHGVGEDQDIKEDGGGDEKEDSTEPMQVHVLVVKILLIMSLVLAMSILAINVEN